MNVKVLALIGVVSVGGGSSMDTAKLIAVLIGSEQPHRRNVRCWTCKRRPSANGVLPRQQPVPVRRLLPFQLSPPAPMRKRVLFRINSFHDWAILDAELTVGLPAHITAATGIDAMVHAIEAFTSKHKKNIVSDTLARQALDLLGNSIHTACKGVSGS